VFCTAFNAYDFLDPAGHFPLRGNGTDGAWFGWPSIPKLEELRDAWFEAPDPETQKSLAREIQTVAMDEVSYVPLGSYLSIMARSRNLVDRVMGPPIFWSIKRA
jgi:peptide/nickel transport system substrate-binding protein